MLGVGRCSSAARALSCDASWTLVRIGRVFAGRWTATVPSATYFPYGMASFESIREDKQFYVDRTALIRVVEETGEQVIINRPPRFGKSLHLDTSFWYYDKSVSEEKRTELFAGTDIGANPTPLRGQFIVLELDLSGIIGSVDQFRERMTNKINTAVKHLAIRHKLSVEINSADGLDTLMALAHVVERTADAKLMILVDEYDRFANQLLLEDRAAYDAVVGRSSTSSPAGPLRALVETFKEISTMLGSRFRSLITGVSPIALHDGFSGYNVAENLSLCPRLGDSFGFTAADVEKGLAATLLSEEERASALKTMVEYYKGYRFPGSTEGVFNPQQCLFFLQALVRYPTFRPLVTSTTTSKEDVMWAMRDSNVAPSGRPVTLAAKCGVGSTVVCELAALTAGQAVTGVELRDSFGVREMLLGHLSTEVSLEESRSLLVSYLFYQGACTLSNDGGGFVVPNQLQKEDFLRAVAARRGSLESAVSDWLSNLDSAGFLRDVLSACVIGLPVAQDGFHESSFQAAVKSSLRAMPVTAEYTLRTWRRLDLLFQLENADVIVELKRVPGSRTQAWKTLKNKSNPASLFYEKDKRAMSELFASLDESALLEEKFLTHGGGQQTVGGLLAGALGQAKSAETFFEERGSEERGSEERPLHYYAALLVHDRVVVRHKRFSPPARDRT